MGDIVAATVIFNGISPVDSNGNVAKYPVLNIVYGGSEWRIRFVHFGTRTYAYDENLDEIILLTYDALAEFAHTIGISCGLDIRGVTALGLRDVTKDSITYRLDPLP